MSIDETIDKNYEVVRVNHVGLTTPFGTEGAVILKTNDGQEFPISAFSGEVAQYISNFVEEKRDILPSIYNLVEQLCEESELLLVKVKLYENANALRANLYFTGRKNIVLRNFRASDAIALATFYGIPILLRKSLLEQTPKTK